MNERIKQLAIQAVGKGFETFATSDFDSQEKIQKFAELIVRECILTIQMGITHDGRDAEKYLRSMKHIRQIKKHFGVEE